LLIGERKIGLMTEPLRDFRGLILDIRRTATTVALFAAGIGHMKLIATAKGMS
jgi:hypothetical protein